MKDSVIIVSGGLDSITLLYDKAETIALAISFDYGQNHGAKELPYAQYHCEKFGYPAYYYPFVVYARVFLRVRYLMVLRLFQRDIMKRRI